MIGQNIDLEVIKSKVATENDLVHSENLNDLIFGEKWGYHSGAIGIAKTSSTLKNSSEINYEIKNIYDLDLRTAWIEGKNDYGKGENFSFKFNYKNPNDIFGNPYNFYGIIEIFNGYCKNEITWKENSRVKRLKVYFNDKPLCFIELKDTWQYQRIDLRKFFKHPNWFPNGKISVVDGDVIKFEIVEIFKGTKYKDTAISEFVFDSPGN